MKRVVVETLHLQTEVLGDVSLGEACQLCHVEIEFVHALIEEGALELADGHSVLDRGQFARLRKAVRLHKDLGVNPPGVALALELMDQL
ncbi:MAG: chaperone modulator CbpM [Pseudomonadaceae bacterium]|nr:chaperone modulator CbpM [Pseudomonadaceae bacterium]